MYSMILVVNSFVIFHNTFSIAVDELNAYSLELIAEALMMEHTVIDAMEEFPWTVETHKFRGTTHQQRTRHIHEQRGLRGHGCHPKVAQNQRHASSHRAPISEFGEDVLPAGCALGWPVVTGVPCVALPSGGKELFRRFRRFLPLFHQKRDTVESYDSGFQMPRHTAVLQASQYFSNIGNSIFCFYAVCDVSSD
jgi:hypothetical protein